MNILRLATADAIRKRVTVQQQTKIKEVYTTALTSTRKEIEKLKFNNSVTSAIRTRQLYLLEQQLTKALTTANGELENIIKSNMGIVVNGAVDEANKFLTHVRFKGQVNYSYVNEQVVKSITTGQVYDTGWSLSKRIWGNNEKQLQDIHKIIAIGTAQNKGSYDIAKDLERYVNPKARKDWNWSKVYPNTNKVIDYNAQRLARTLVSHAYQQSTQVAHNDNPFVTGYIWYSALIHGRTCEICTNRNEVVYSKNEVPLDHPNGLCTIAPVLSKSLKEISSDVADWYNGNSNEELDTWSEKLQEQKQDKFYK